MSRLQEIARQRLATAKREDSLEALWGQFALESLAAGRPVDPEVAEVRRLTAPDRAWRDVPPWPRDWLWFRVDALFRAHRLAIVREDRDWLAELQRCWEPAHEDMYASPLRALGEIGLGLGRGGPRPFGWTEEEVTILSEEGVIRPDVCDSQAWLALASGDQANARRALTEYESFLAGVEAKWAAEPEKGADEASSHPDLALRVQCRALGALLDRTTPR
jgi:hypothetical protein